MRTDPGTSVTRAALADRASGGPTRFLELARPSAPADAAIAQLRWFSTLWAMALAYHFVEIQPLGILPLLLVVAPALLMPASTVACALVLTATGLIALASLPTTANHLVLGLAAALTLGIAAVHPRVTRPRGDTTLVERWLSTARIPVLLVLLAVYFFAVFHKLNTAFLDPATSCAQTMLAHLIQRSGVAPLNPGPSLVGALALATVLTEGALLVLLAVPRWRCRGVLLGVGFHSVLALTGFAHFTTFVFALYVLVIPRSVFQIAAPRWVRARRIALTAFAVHVVLGLGAAVVSTPVSPVGLQWTSLLGASWLVAVGALMVPLVWGSLAARTARWGRTPATPAVLLLVPLLAFGNGALPYLGLKTVASYAMYSNLSTEEGRTNHLISATTALQVAGYQRDTVTVSALLLPEDVEPVLVGHRGIRTAAPWTAEPLPVRMPWLELRRTVLLWRDAGVRGVAVEYVHAGSTRLVPDAVVDPVLAAPLPWWEQHLLGFRAIDSAAGADHCRW